MHYTNVTSIWDCKSVVKKQFTELLKVKVD